MALTNLDDADAVLRDFATRHGIRRLALLGWFRGEETPPSDVELDVEFEEGRTPGLLSMAELELEIGAVLGREVKLRTVEGLSRYQRDEVRVFGHVRLISVPLRDEVQVHHLIKAGSKAASYAAGRSRDDLDDDELLRLALTKLVEIVAEAAKHVSHDLRESHPEVPWSAAARMRDRLVHHYFDINLDVLWSTVTDDLPRLLAVLPDNLVRDGSAPTDRDRRCVDEQ